MRAQTSGCFAAPAVQSTDTDCRCSTDGHRPRRRPCSAPTCRKTAANGLLQMWIVPAFAAGPFHARIVIIGVHAGACGPAESACSRGTHPAGQRPTELVPAAPAGVQGGDWRCLCSTGGHTADWRGSVGACVGIAQAAAPGACLQLGRRPSAAEGGVGEGGRQQCNKMSGEKLENFSSVTPLISDIASIWNCFQYITGMKQVFSALNVLLLKG